MADSVIVEFGAKLDGLIHGVQEAKSTVLDFATGITEGLVAAFSIHEINEFVEKMTNLNVQVQRASALMGVSTSAIAGLNIAAEMSGSTIEGLSMAMTRLGMNLSRAESNAISPANAALKALGLSIKEFMAVPAETKLELLAQRFSVLKDGIDKDAIAIALLGRMGAQMIPTFNEGAEALRQYNDIAQRAGSQSFPAFEAAAHSLHMQTIELSQSFQGLGMQILTVFQPALSAAYKILADLVQQFTNSIREGGAFGVALQGVAVAAQVVATALVISIKALETLWEVVKIAVQAMANDFIALGRIIKDVFTLNFADISAAWNDLMAANSAVIKRSADNMESIFKRSVDQLKTIWGEGADHIEKVEQTKNAHLQLYNSQAVQAAMAAAQERIKIANFEYQMVTGQIKAQFGDFWFTERAKTSALLAALETRHAAESAAAEEMLRVTRGSVVEYQKAVNEKKNIDMKYALDRQKIILDAAKQEQQTWEHLGTGITTAFNSQLRGLLAGTTTFREAMGHMIGDLIIWMIEEFEKMAVKWIAMELVKTTATEAGVAARTAAEASGSAASSAMVIPGIIKSIFNSAAQTFAGVFGFLSPVMGPFAAGPAAASEAVVAGVAGSVAALDIGTDYVAKSGLAMIHEGEQIVPAQAQTPFTGKNMGGGSTSISVHAWDARSVQQWLQSGGDKILAAAVSRQQNRNPSLRPAY